MKNKSNEDVNSRMAAVHNKNATEKVLLIGANDTSQFVRALSMVNENATMKVLSIGANDREESVRNAAKKNPNWKGTNASFISSATKRLGSVK